jgi:type I restriction enzyme S subunit
LEHVADDVAAMHGLRLFPRGTVLFAKSGMSATKGLVHELREPAYVVSHLAALVPKGDLEPAYLRHWFGAHPPSRLINDAAYPSIRLPDIAALKIPLPPLAEQRRIAAVLDKADAIRRKRRESLRLLDEFLRSAFLEMFGDPVRNDRGWEARRLGELATIRRGASPRPIERYLGGTIPWIKISDATASSDLYIHGTAEAVTEAGAARSVRLEPGAIVVANSGVSLGFARILRIAGCIHDGWLSIEMRGDHLNKVFFVSFINAITTCLRAMAPTGTQPNLNTGIMQNLRVPLPPHSLQDRFAQLTEATQGAAMRIRSAIQASEDFFESLAQQAFRGGF